MSKRNVNICVLTGVLVSEVKESGNGSGKFVAKAVISTQVNGGIPDLHRIVLFEETAKEALSKYKKGDTCWIKGKIRAYKYNGKLINEIWVSELDTL